MNMRLIKLKCRWSFSPLEEEAISPVGECTSSGWHNETLGGLNNRNIILTFPETEKSKNVLLANYDIGEDTFSGLQDD